MSDNIDYSSIEEVVGIANATGIERLENPSVPIVRANPLVPSFYDLPKEIQSRILDEARLLEVRERNEVRENFDQVLRTRTFNRPLYPETFIYEDGQPVTINPAMRRRPEFRRMQRR
tara:strand:- start:918 stop:1268 length:351 start_codon:yes stop_codon:yes gene_type:complete